MAEKQMTIDEFNMLNDKGMVNCVRVINNDIILVTFYDQVKRSLEQELVCATCIGDPQNKYLDINSGNAVNE